MLQIANAFFKLPGDYLLPHEEEIPGFQARLSERLSPPAGSSIPGADQDIDSDGVLGDGPFDWRIHDCVAQWWRPNFETFMYPFIPAHVTRPKECKKMYLIQLPKKSMFFLLFEGQVLMLICVLEMLSVPKNMKLLAVPLFELYDNTARYGPQLSVCTHVKQMEYRTDHRLSLISFHDIISSFLMRKITSFVVLQQRISLHRMPSRTTITNRNQTLKIHLRRLKLRFKRTIIADSPAALWREKLRVNS